MEKVEESQIKKQVKKMAFIIWNCSGTQKINFLNNFMAFVSQALKYSYDAQADKEL